MTADEGPPPGAAPAMTFRSPEYESGSLSWVGAAVVCSLVVLVAVMLGTVSLLLAVVFLVVTGAAWMGIRAAMRRLRVDLFDTGILVCNVVGSTWIPRREVASISGGGQLRVDLVDGRQILCFAVGRSNYGWLRGQPGYDDRVAEQIRQFWASDTQR